MFRGIPSGILRGVSVLCLFSCCFFPVAYASSSGVVEGPLVVSRNWPECTTLQTWVQDIMRLGKVEQASETAQGRVFFTWLRLFSRMATGGMLQAHEGEYGQEKYVLDAHKNLFVYGWGYCDTHSRIAQAAWSEFKKNPHAAERVVVQHADGGYHTMYRLKMDGRYGAFDARYGYYLVERDDPDARILDWAEVGDDQNILKNKAYKNRSTPFFEYFGREWDRALLLQPVYYESEEDWVKAGKPVESVFGNSQYKMGTPFHDMSFQLPQGAAIERYWDNSARQFYVPAGFESKGEEPFRPSGRFYRITESMLDGNWVKNDPNYKLLAPYLATVPVDEGYNSDVSGGRTIGQAWGKFNYRADFQDPSYLKSAPLTTTFRHSTSPPLLTPTHVGGGGEAIFDFYCPYVFVNGALRGEWVASAADSPRIALRVLQPKPAAENEPEVWSEWQELGSAPGVFEFHLGRERFNGKDLSIHGVYRFQLRFSLQQNPSRQKVAGLKSVSLETFFENSITSIPRITAGENTIQFKVRDESLISTPIKVTYHYRTSAGKGRHEKVLRPADFNKNMATYQLNIPDLIRCDSLVISH
jgi:hypothetical protein